MRMLRITVLTLSAAVVFLFVGLVIAGRSDERGLFRALGNLTEVVHLIHENYVDEVDLGELEAGLERGLVESVDPWACMVDDAEAFSDLVSSPPAYGLVLTRRLGAAAVRQVFPGSPAETARLERGEIIERIDDLKTRLIPLWEVRELLAQHVAAGRPVTLTVMTVDVDERREVELNGGAWEPSGISVSDRDGVRVIEVWALPEGASDSAAASVEGGETLILDLRELCWGFEGEAIAVADLFAESGELAEWRGRRDTGDVHEATPGAAGGALLVLVGPRTEGVGEVLASALQRSGATLVGEPSSGHAVHMGLIHQDGVSIYMPIGLWLAADGSPIRGDGIVPGEAVQPSAGGSDDPVLERALELAAEAYDEAA